MDEQQKVEQDRAELRAAWDELIANLQDARNVIDDTDRFAPEPTGADEAGQ